MGEDHTPGSLIWVPLPIGVPLLVLAGWVPWLLSLVRASICSWVEWDNSSGFLQRGRLRQGSVCSVLTPAPRKCSGAWCQSLPINNDTAHLERQGVWQSSALVSASDPSL